MLPILHVSMQDFEPGSKEYQALMRALSALSPLFGRGGGGEQMLPATIQAMARDAQAMKPPTGGLPPGGPPPKTPPPPSMGPAASELGGEA